MTFRRPLRFAFRPAERRAAFRLAPRFPLRGAVRLAFRAPRFAFRRALGLAFASPSPSCGPAPSSSPGRLCVAREQPLPAGSCRARARSGSRTCRSTAWAVWTGTSPPAFFRTSFPPARSDSGFAAASTFVAQAPRRVRGPSRRLRQAPSRRNSDCPAFSSVPPHPSEGGPILSAASHVLRPDPAVPRVEQRLEAPPPPRWPTGVVGPPGPRPPGRPGRPRAGRSPTRGGVTPGPLGGRTGRRRETGPPGTGCSPPGWCGRPPPPPPPGPFPAPLPHRAISRWPRERRHGRGRPPRAPPASGARAPPSKRA